MFFFTYSFHKWQVRKDYLFVMHKNLTISSKKDVFCAKLLFRFAFINGGIVSNEKSLNERFVFEKLEHQHMH